MGTTGLTTPPEALVRGAGLNCHNIGKRGREPKGVCDWEGVFFRRRRSPDAACEAGVYVSGLYDEENNEKKSQT